MQSTRAQSGLHPITRVVVPVEGSDREYVAQQWAVELAAALGTTVFAVHVHAATKPPADDQFLFIENACKKWAVTLEARSIESTDIVETILEDLVVTDLVVMGTRRLGTDFHLGSVAERLIRKAPCPVQVVRLE